jgi:hypothetical protein
MAAASRFSERYWQGEPTTGEGVCHAVVIDINLDAEAACGRVCESPADYKAPREQLVTCVRCWAALCRP